LESLSRKENKKEKYSRVLWIGLGPSGTPHALVRQKSQQQKRRKKKGKKNKECDHAQSCHQTVIFFWTCVFVTFVSRRRLTLANKR